MSIRNNVREARKGFFFGAAPAVAGAAFFVKMAGYTIFR